MLLCRDHLLGLFDWLVPVSLRFLRREIREAAPTCDANLVVTLMRLFTSMIDHMQVRPWADHPSCGVRCADAYGPCTGVM